MSNQKNANINFAASIKRIALLARKEFIESRKAILIASATVTGVYLVVSILNTAFGNAESYSHVSNFLTILVLGGLISSSLAFSDLHSKGKNINWIMTPASQMEKYITNLLSTTLGIVVYILVVYFLFSLVSHLINLVAFGRSFGLFNPFQKPVWRGILVYLVVQPTFLFGAIYFRSLHFLKTLLSLIILGIILSLLSGIILRLVFADYFIGLSFRLKPEIEYLFSSSNNLSLQFETLFQAYLKPLEIAGKIVTALIAPFFWIVGYIRLTETEVRNGV